MTEIDPAKIWSLQYRLIAASILSVAPRIATLGLEMKELFVLIEIDEHTNPAKIAATLSMPKPTVTLYLKSLEAAGFVRREIDAEDLRRHRLRVTPTGRKVLTRGRALLSGAFGARLARLTVAEQVELKRLLEKVI